MYAGIQRLEVQGATKDYLKIQYSGSDVLYVPVTQLDLLSRYTPPGDEDKVRLAKLGGAEWQRTRARVKKATEEMAQELIELYARRKQARGFAFPPDGEWQQDFEARFEYDETEDQLAATAEIKNDMEHAWPMDRLLCGDVGVGKTEVALRAAFKCVMGGKQCAILAPTTLLAWQHYNTILSRMEAFPVRVELLSRFRTAKQQKEALRSLQAGSADIVVGTHRLLSKDVRFHDLGLVIIDEEQRFGVRHKEKLKQSFIGVDSIGLGQRHELVIDLVVPERLGTHRVLGLLSHRHPGVGEDAVGVLRGLLRVGGHQDRAAGLRGDAFRIGHDLRVGQIPVRSGTRTCIPATAPPSRYELAMLLAASPK